MALNATTKMLLALEELRKIDPEMQAQQAVVLLAVAKQPGLSQSDAMQLAGVARSSISRIYARLSDLPGGLGLLRMEEDMNDRRIKIARLTPHGSRILASITRILED